MAKLTVRNVGPIREAELEVKKHTVFIGPQGSGKSTLAKLIAIGGDGDIIQNMDVNQAILRKYAIDKYIISDSHFKFTADTHSITNERSRTYFSYMEESDRPVFSKSTYDDFINDILTNKNLYITDKEALSKELTKYVVEKRILSITSSYVPAERTLLAVLNEAIWSLIHSEVDFPKSITSFASSYETARNQIKTLYLHFLNIHYKNQDGKDQMFVSSGYTTDLSQSASGYQSVVPLFLVVEYQRRQSQRRFIIEEPELNLYPTAQKDLIYALMGGLDPTVEYKDAEWVITTHSPYVLSSFNTLMLAYKVAQRSDELRAEVEKIIPARCWINPDEFAAYYVDSGTVRSIISDKTGLIADNELDDVSEDLANEQDQLLELSRSVPRA